MERWRWLPRVLGRTHVVVNVPDYTLAVYRNSSPLWRTRVVVGKPSSPTPLLTETMKFITVNPTWNVPPSIIQNELLPVYQTQDPQIFERLGLRVERNRDGSLHVYQPPGERNALGRIRFNFPNKFLVYQHDTPERHLFAQARRAFSHGCMRVQDPSRYAAVLLSYASPKLGLTEVAIAAMFGGPERQIDLQVPVPVHITYQTAFVDEHGKLVLRDDIYGLDARMLSLLRGGDRNGIDLALERPAERPARRQAEAFRPLYPSAGRPIGGESSGRATVFDRVFR
jgi:murein L,D-transpeptidase YcbB/YkuD